MALFCGCLHARLGSYIAVLFWIVMSMMGMITSVYLFYHWHFWTSLTSMIGYVIIDIIDDAIMFLVTCLLCFALVKEKAGWIMPWVVYNIIYVILNVITGSLVLSVVPWKYDVSDPHIIAILYFIVVFIDVLLLACVVRRYLDLKNYWTLDDDEFKPKEIHYISWPFAVTLPTRRASQPPKPAYVSGRPQKLHEPAPHMMPSTPTAAYYPPGSYSDDLNPPPDLPPPKPSRNK